MLEVEDVLQVGAAPLVDGLVGIADDAEVAVVFGKAADQQVLGAVRILVLVDHHEPELLAVTRARMRRGLEQVHRLQQQVVEVERVAVLERRDVVGVDTPNLLVTRVPAAAKLSGPAIVFFAWLMRESATRGCTKLSSIFRSRSACLTTDSWSAES